MSMNKTTLGSHPTSHDRPLLEKNIDAYKAKGKLPEPTLCPKCHAVFHNGRWQWGVAPINAHSEVCPACHRIQDNLPMGFFTLDGSFFNEHNQEIISLIYNHEQHERAEHPLKRIIAIERQGDSTLVTTTDTHLARGLGEAVHHAYQGDLRIDHTSGESLVRVYWNR